MIKFAFQKILHTMLVMLGVSLLTFFLGRFTPGDPVETLLSANPNPTLEDRRLAEEYLGLDKPMLAQYFTWVERVLYGDFGTSYKTGRAVSYELSLRFPASMKLAGGAVITMLIVGFSLGIFSALNQNNAADYIIRIINIILISIPTFCLGILLIITFGVKLKVLPTMGSEKPIHLILPSVSIGLGAGANLARLIRTQMLSVMGKDHVIAAITYGVSRRRVIINHILKNVFPPILTNIGISIGALIGGSAIIETLFVWAGAGSYLVEAIAGRDYPIIQAYALIMSFVYVALNLLIDFSYRLLMPSAVIMETQNES